MWLRCLSCFVLLTSLSSVSGQDDGTSAGVSTYQDTYQLGIQVHEDAGRGLIVDSINANGPATQMVRSDNAKVKGILDRGDRIVAVNGTAIRDLRDYTREMEQAHNTNGQVRITVRDVRTGDVVDWNVRAQLNRVALRPQPNNFEFRLGFQCIETLNGLKIEGLTPNGPMTRMQDARGQVVKAEVGDVVTAINGQKIQSLNQYYAAMSNVRSDGWLNMTLRDVRSGQEYTWNARAERTATNIQPNRRGRKAHVLLCGLTSDESIGNAISISVQHMKTIVESGLDPQFIGSFEVLTGAQCNAQTILHTVDNIGTGPDDAVFVYYLGHGAYDNSLAANDPSGGHFFQIPSGDLPRKVLFSHMQSKRPRLTVLITDTCNVAAIARPRSVLEQRTRTMTAQKLTNIEELLLSYQGSIDISASSRDQFSWFTSNLGGWFSFQFSGAFCEERDWQSLFRRVSEKSNDYFHQRKTAILANPGDTKLATLQNLRSQSDMLPQAFRFDINRDPYVGPAPQGPRTKENTYTVEVDVRYAD